MAGLFSKLFRGSGTVQPPALPPNRRIYAIGDIHGRLDLLGELGEAIEQDDASRPPMQSTVILLGDLVDRGPDSRGVIDFARKWGMLRDVRILSGNHEEMFLNAFLNEGRFRGFLRFGGVETLASYGLDAIAMLDMEFAEVRHRLTRAVPKADRDFLRSFELTIRIGDYLFVHAGIHPKVPLDQLVEHDCRWIREPFLSYTGDLGCMVVHGHSITPQVELRQNRIGIDTGAYDSNVLTALCLEGTDRRLLQTQIRDGRIVVRESPANRPEDHLQLMPGSL